MMAMIAERNAAIAKTTTAEIDTPILGWLPHVRSNPQRRWPKKVQQSEGQ